MIRIFVVFLLLAVASSCSRRPGQEPVKAASGGPAPLAVKTAAAATRAFEKSISVTGSLYPDESVNVSSEVPGRVMKIHADFGQSVRQGQVLAELDPQEYDIQIERGRAAMAQALARLGLEMSNTLKAPDSTPMIRQAEAQLEDAKSKFDSAKKLMASGDIAPQRYTELEKAYIARQAGVDAARDEMRTLWASISALRADLKLLEKRRQDTVVRAPFDAEVGSRAVSPGQYVRDNAVLMTLVKTSPLRLRAEIPESGVAAVKIGTTLTFTTEAHPGVDFRAVVRELNPSLDPRSRTLVAEARMLAPDARLRPGMFVQVRLVITAAASVVAVPRTAVHTVAGLTKLFTVAGGVAREKKFVPGLESEGWVEVPGGIVKAGERVAVSNLPLLTDGAAVKE